MKNILKYFRTYRIYKSNENRYYIARRWLPFVWMLCKEGKGESRQIVSHSTLHMAENWIARQATPIPLAKKTWTIEKQISV